jgi:hypothetical protein
VARRQPLPKQHVSGPCNTASTGQRNEGARGVLTVKAEAR